MTPAVVIAGTHSGVGKTTVATGLMAALGAAGHAVAPFKVGPDYIDPGYHALAAGRPSRNLDLWMCGEVAVRGLFHRGCKDAGIAVVEGVMGMFDGPGSTAEVAALLGAPVVLVVDASAMSGSAAAVVHGFRSFDPSVRLAGVIWNRVGSSGHRQLLDDAVAPLGVPVLGALGRDDRLIWRDRHLGLVPVAERTAEIKESLRVLGELVASSVDLAEIVRVAKTSAPVPGEPWQPIAISRATGRRPTVAVAGGSAFTFCYPELPEALAAAGADVVGFDPLRDESLPESATGMFVGGGFPEVFAADLAANGALRSEVARRLAGGTLAAWGECAGYLWLCRSLDGAPMVGAISADAEMTSRLTLGYREGETLGESPLGPPGTAVRGHEFHYSRLIGGTGPPAYGLRGRNGETTDGAASAHVVAGFLHSHPAATPELIPRFVGRAHAVAAR